MKDESNVTINNSDLRDGISLGYAGGILINGTGSSNL